MNFKVSQFSFLLIVLVVFNGLHLFSAVELPSGTVSSEAMESYYASLRQEIDKEEAKVQALLERARKGQQVPAQVQRVEFEHAIVMLDVKKTLYTNFYETDTIQKSAAVREMLHAILSKQDVTVSDLSALQNLVKQEKKRLNLK